MGHHFVAASVAQGSDRQCSFVYLQRAAIFGETIGKKQSSTRV
jgi:hypothetical protein